MSVKQKERSRKKSQRDFSLNRHHVLPSSRGGSNHYSNIAKVDKLLHRDYHNLFSNLTPDEIIVYLVNYFWKGQEKWVEIALSELKQEE